MSHDPNQLILGVGNATRGGPLQPLNVDEAVELIKEKRAAEYKSARTFVLYYVKVFGEFHADMLATAEFTQRNVIGAAVRGLCQQQIIQSTGEHRASMNDVSHGRRSYVYERGPKWTL